MGRRIARIKPLVPAVAAVVGSVSLSLAILRPPPAELLLGTAPADRGHVGALVLPEQPLSRSALHRQQEGSSPAPIGTSRVIPRRQTPRPAPSASPVRRSRSPRVAKPAPAPPERTTPAPSTPPAAPESLPAAPPQVLARNGPGPPASTSPSQRHHGRPPCAGHPRGRGASSAAARPPHKHAGCHGKSCATAAAPHVEHGDGQGDGHGNGQGDEQGNGQGNRQGNGQGNRQGNGQGGPPQAGHGNQQGGGKSSSHH
jgi:hypothetical protein